MLDCENINGREVVILEDEDVSTYPRFGTPSENGNTALVYYSLGNWAF